MEPGDEAIAFEPYYDSYAARWRWRGDQGAGHAAAAGFPASTCRAGAAITPRTRVILLNTPHNPTGAVFTPAELAEIAAVACDHDLLVVSDEVYEHLVFEGEHVPIATLPGMGGRTVTISSAAKTFSFTGWKVGWVTGRPELVTAVRTVKQFLTYVCGGPFQYAVGRGARPAGLLLRLRGRDLRGKRDFFCDGPGRGRVRGVPARRDLLRDH